MTQNRKQAELKETMIEAVSTAYQLVCDVISTGASRVPKEDVFKEVMDVVALGPEFEFTGDNWQDDPEDPEGKRSIMPLPTASITLTRRGEDKAIEAVAMISVAGDNRILFADGGEVGISTIDEMMERDFSRIIGVKNNLLQLPPTLQIFGQKSSEHWVTMNSVIGDLNRAGIKVANDCGPYFALRDWFSECHDGIISPRNMVYCEPYANKPKEEVVASVIRCLNRMLPEGQRFIITDMSGGPLFEDSRIKRNGVDEKYASSGYIIAPTLRAHHAVLSALHKSVNNRSEFVTAKNGSKMRLLAHQLSRYQS